MDTVPSESVKKTRTDEIFFIDPACKIELNPEKAIPAEEKAFYSAPSDSVAGAPNTTTWD